MSRTAQLLALASVVWLPLQGGVRIAHAQRAPSPTSTSHEERTLLERAERDTGNAQSAGAIGEYYLHQGKWKQSVPWLKKAYALSSGDETIGYDLAYANMQAGELESAKKSN